MCSFLWPWLKLLNINRFPVSTIFAHWGQKVKHFNVFLLNISPLHLRVKWRGGKKKKRKPQPPSILLMLMLLSLCLLYLQLAQVQRCVCFWKMDCCQVLNDFSLSSYCCTSGNYELKAVSAQCVQNVVADSNTFIQLCCFYLFGFISRQLSCYAYIIIIWSNSRIVLYTLYSY